jgi:CheY-like chemotaxis protein
MMPERAALPVPGHAPKLDEALAENERLRRLARSVAHDLNNILAVVTGYSELILRGLRPNDPLRGNAESIKKATEWGIALAQDVLAAVRRQPAAATPVDLNQLVANVGRVLQPIVGERIEVVTRLDPALGRVNVNQGQMGQVLMNLVVNARDAMPNGGRLTLETCRAGEEVLLSVSDTGSGMDAVTREHMFEPYFTTKEPGKGTGLGLSTVHDVVIQNGGRIEVASDTGEGSTFTIYLPVYDEGPEPEETPAPARGDVTAGAGRTVLLVEDEGEVRMLIREILQMHGYDVLEARDRAHALQLGARYPGTMDLVIVSVARPGPATDEVVQDVVAARPGIKVLYVSGYLEDHEEWVGHPRLGPVLQKPFTVADLTDTIARVLRG